MMQRKSPTSTADTFHRQPRLARLGTVTHTYNRWHTEEDDHDFDVILSYTPISRPVCGTHNPFSANRKRKRERGRDGGRGGGRGPKVTGEPRRWYLHVLL